MPTLNGIDTRTDLTPYASALRQQHGIDFAMRYYSHTLSKNLGRAEAAALSAASVQIGVVWESAGTSDSFFSAAQGGKDGQAALALAAEVGQPAGSAIYFAVDYDASQKAIDGPVSDYFRALGALLDAAGYTVGAYGSGACCASLQQAQLASLGWLSQSAGFLGSRDYAAARRYNLLQKAGAVIQLGTVALSVDANESNADRDTGLFLCR